MSFEYTTDDTWSYKQPPAKPEWFDAELKKIGGTHSRDIPNLRVVWGGNEMSDKSHEAGLKYPAAYKTEVKGWRYKDDEGEHFVTDIDNIDPSIMVIPDIREEILGTPRWFIEKWTSPEELERQGRFQTVKDADGQVLRDFPREGVYDAYLIVENLQGEYRGLDRDLLDYLFERAKFEKLSFAERENLRDEANAAKIAEMDKHNEEIWEAAKNFDIKLDPAERERREHYWATKDDYEAEYERIGRSISVFQTA